MSSRENSSSKRRGSVTGQNADPSNSQPSNRPPKKAWEWYYRSFLSRSWGSNHHTHSGSDAAIHNKSPPKKIKDRFKSLGNKLHRRSATIAESELNSSPSSNTAGDVSEARISSSWNEMTQPVCLWDSPLSASPSSTATSPPKLYSRAPHYHAPFGRVQQALLFKGGYSGSGSSLSMIDESVNDCTPLNESRVEFSTNDVLFGLQSRKQEQQRQEERQVSNLSLQMKQYLTTKNNPTHQQTDQQGLESDATEQGLPFKLSYGNRNTEGGSRSINDTHDPHYNRVKPPVSSTTLIAQGTEIYVGNTEGNLTPKVACSPRRQRNEMDSSIRLGSVRRLGAMSRAVSANSLASMSSVFTGQRSKMYDSKSRKLAFTKFHNSAQFGKDSASAYLGDDASVHRTALSDPIIMATNSKSNLPAPAVEIKNHSYDLSLLTGAVSSSTQSNIDGRPSPAASPSTSLGFGPIAAEFHESDVLLFETKASGEGRMVHSESVTVVKPRMEAMQTPVLNALPYHNVDSPSILLRRYTKDGTNCPNLIGPMVLTVCSSQYMPPLLPCILNSSSFSLPMGMLVLGFAKVSRSSPAAISSNIDKIGFCDSVETPMSPSLFHGSHFSYFVLYHNYLLEYQCTPANNENNCKNHDNIWSDRPVGYAHLENASIRRVEVKKRKYTEPHEVTTDGDAELDFLELSFDGSSPTMLSQIKVLFLVDNFDELRRWIVLLRRASKFTTDALYTICSINSSTDRVGNGEIGRGRYSTIYSAIKCPPDNAAHHTTMRSRQRALKFVSKDQFFYRVERQRERADTLLREVIVQSVLSRHIVSSCPEPSNVPILQTLGMFETRTHLILEMELLGGEDLFNYMSTASQRNEFEGGGLAEYEACCIARNIFEALVVLKSMGIAHRDVKPANLLICSTKSRMPPIGMTRVKLCDFGMATFVGPDGLVRGRCGTPGYVAPEILSSGLQSGYPNKVDTFSAGVTLYVMMCGYEPFYGESEEQLILANKEAKVEFPESDWESVSSHAKDLICKLMEPNSANRIDVDDVLRHPWFQESNAITDSDSPPYISLPTLGPDDHESSTGCIVC